MFDLKPQLGCVSDLAFDEVLSDSTDPSARAQVLEHLEACVRCGVRFELIAAQRKAFLERVPSWQALCAQQEPPAQHAVPAARRVPSRPWLWGVWGAGLLASAAAFAALLLFSSSPGSAPPIGIRTKGGPRLGAYIKHGEQVTRADDGTRVRPGDYVRFTYSSDRPVHFALLNRDAAHASTYFPEQGTQTAPMNAGHDVALDFSIKLDDQPGQEQIYGVFCERPEPLEPLRAALESSGRLPPLPHCQVERLTLDKSGE